MKYIIKISTQGEPDTHYELTSTKHIEAKQEFLNFRDGFLLHKPAYQDAITKQWFLENSRKWLSLKKHLFRWDNKKYQLCSVIKDGTIKELNV
jgi:hypothetical protein